MIAGYSRWEMIACWSSRGRFERFGMVIVFKVVDRGTGQCSMTRGVAR